MERRVEDLEIKIAFLEQHIEELSGVIREFADRVVSQERELQALKEQMELNGVASATGHEKPPHYGV